MKKKHVYVGVLSGMFVAGILTSVTMIKSNAMDMPSSSSSTSDSSSSSESCDMSWLDSLTSIPSTIEPPVTEPTYDTP